MLALSIAARARAQLTLAVEVGPDPVRSGVLLAPSLGPQLDVRVTVTNRGATSVANVRVEVPLPVELLTVNRLSIIGGTCNSLIGNVNNCNNPEIAIFDVGTLAPGAGRTLGFPVFVREAADGTIIRIAASAGTPAPIVFAERSVIVESAPAFELSLSEDREPVGPGEELEYTVTYGHVAPARLAPGALLRFELPDGTSFVSATDGGVHGAGAIEWSLGDLEPGDAGERRVTLRVDAIAGSVLEARAEIVDGDTPSRSARAHAITRVESAPLGLVLEIGPNPLPSGASSSGRTLDVRLTVSNRGAVVIPGVTVRVPLPARLDTLARLGTIGGTCDSLIGIVNGCDFPESALFDLGDIPPGDGGTVAFSAFVRELPDGSIVDIEAFALSAVAGQQAVDAQSVVTRRAPAFELSLAEDREPVAAGEEIEYTVSFGHVSTARIAPGSTLRLELPGQTTFVSSTDDGIHDGGVVEWSLGDLPPGDSGERRAVVRVEAGLGEGRVLEARAEILDADSPARSARAHAATRVESSPLGLVLELGPDPLRSGSELAPTFGRTLEGRLTVTNRGAVVLPDVLLLVPLPARLASLARLGTVGGSCNSLIGSVNSCDHPEVASFAIGDLAAGRGRTVAFSVFVRELPDASLVDLVAYAVSPAAGEQAIDRRSVILRRAPAFELSIVEDREPVRAGEEIEYTISYGHVATARLARQSSLWLELPADASFVSASDGGVHADGVVEWSLGDLEPGASGERRVVVLVDAALGDAAVLEARAEIADVATPVERARARLATRVEEVSPLEVDLVVVPDPARRGDTLQISLTVRNQGDAQIPAARLLVPIPERLDTINRLLIEGGSCDSIVGNVNNCNRPERVVFDLGVLGAGETRRVGFPARVVASAELAPGGALIPFRAFLDGAGYQALDGEDLRIAETGRFVRGDANADGRFDIADAVFTLGFLFLGTRAPTCLDAADSDNNSVIQITDGIYSLNFLFTGGPALPPPTGAIPADCGEDPAPEDGLGCLAYPPCRA